MKHSHKSTIAFLLVIIVCMLSACSPVQTEVPESLVRDLVDMNEYADMGKYTLTITHHPDKETHRDHVDIVISIQTPYAEAVSTCSAVYEYNRSSDLWSLVKCEDWTRPYYNPNDKLIGTWETSYGTAEVTFDEITFHMDGETYGPYDYKASVDSGYAYLEFEDEGYPLVFVVINEDMAALCESDVAYADFAGFTPYGTPFDADIYCEDIFYRSGVSTKTLPAIITEEMVDELVAEVGSNYFYYEKAQVISIPGYWGFPAIAITEAGDISGMEYITLIGCENSYYDCIPAKGNFIITDAS